LISIFSQKTCIFKRKYILELILYNL